MSSTEVKENTVLKNAENMKEKDSKKRINIFAAFIKLFPPAFKASPFLLMLTILLSILHGLSWGVNTSVTQKFFDAAEQTARGEAGLSSAIMALVWLGLIHFANQFLNGVSNFIPQVFGEKAIGKLQKKINQKMGSIDPVRFEDTSMLDDINKAYEGLSHSVWFVILFFMVFTFYLPYFLYMAWYLFSLKPILAISIVIVFLPTLMTQIIRTKVFAKLEDKAAPIRRQMDYYENCIAGREYFKETRLLGAFDYFIDLYRSTVRLLNKISWQAFIKTGIYELLMRLVALAGYLVILYMLFDALMNREITAGAFAAVFASIGMLFGIMEEVVCRHFGNIAQNLGTIQNYLNFLEIPERKGEITDIESECDITLDNVSFSYPKSENPAIKNVSLTIRNGETVAIVGENGSGKSTLVRLITGIYLPSSGSVLYGAIRTQDVSIRSMFKNISGVFQKYQRYQLTLRENIGISDVETEAEDGILDKVSGMSGLDLSDQSFINGYDTMLSREFDGVDLSGGQWQRVAIARGFYRAHNIIVLDEPTAAIDPLEETKIYNRFAEISRGKTAVIVTHRLGSVKLADRIIVMDKGEVEDIGTHDELISRKGKYSQMWNAQAQYYV